MNTACFLPYVGLGTCLLHMSYIREFARKNGPVKILTFSKSLADALKFDQDVKEVIVIEKYNKKFFDILKLANFLKNLQLKKLYIFKSSLRFYFAGKLARIETKSYPFYKKKNLHLVKEAQKFTNKNLNLKDCPTETTLQVSQTLLDETKKTITSNKKNILIAPAASGDTTMWGSTYFIKLMKKLDAKFNCFFIIAVDSSEREKKIANEIIQSFDKNKTMSLSNKTISQTMPIISCCSVSICNDTSFQHLSCGLNVPTIILRFDTPDAYSSYSKFQYSVLPEGHSKINHDSRADPSLISVDQILNKVIKLIN